MQSLVDWAETITGDNWVTRAGFTSRQGGFSRGPYAGLNLGFHVADDPDAVAANRRALAEELGVEPVWMDQVHGKHIGRAVKPGRTLTATDGAILSFADLGIAEQVYFRDKRKASVSGAESFAPSLANPGGGDASGMHRVAACVMVADCVPLLLLSLSSPVGAVVHVGRAGLLADIAMHAVTELSALTEVEDLVATIGPAICGQCYEVPAQMRDAAALQCPECVAETRWGTPSIDIPAGLHAQLARAGVPEIRHDRRCTFEAPSLFSHRRDGGVTGRFVGIVEVATRPGSLTNPGAAVA
ncbi:MULTISPECIES: polyphenol oxidase family protein [unclassified Actinobaculum]|uniref:polyphenol oxidase family protein n=1 Tax=unclassified Actinobaculum TaxID=2609299 RepID=UPI000D529772|nr:MULTISPECIES: polyphenol oxidase family protein [unclassified Actinobaculum]AWE42591.1 hypothetical protein DDD63_07310 [Actinobaculum sp. 313]RTE48118.1 laccase domain-containing protein [Actinobaculum sp. 352]